MSRYCEQSAKGCLNDWVECGWFLESAVAIPAHKVPPDGCVDIVYDRDHGLRVIGTMTREQCYHLPDAVAMTGVRFRPGMAGAFLGVSPAELTDGSASLADLWSMRARALEQQLDEARSIRDAMRLLLGCLATPKAPPNSVQRAIDALTAAKGNADLDTLATQAGLSPRQFRRRCLEESGLPPKQLARVLRFRHACSMARSTERVSWTIVALDAGYCDQSHFIRDFRAFTGQAPMAVLSNTANTRPG